MNSRLKKFLNLGGKFCINNNLIYIQQEKCKDNVITLDINDFLDMEVNNFVEFYQRVYDFIKK